MEFRLATKHEEFFRSNSPTVRALVKSLSELAECVVRYEDDPGGYVQGRHETMKLKECDQSSSF